ncbi:MAG TPA: TolC family protein [Caulobacteraceae bacterium]|nr:TolC family protein [Caulobacteraceae bacterium]
MRPRQPLALLGALAAAASLAACAVGPDYIAPRPPPAAGAGFIGAQGAGEFAQQPLPAHWWRLYDDPTLDGLEIEALARNADLQVAAANLLYAQALLSEARDNRFPTTQLSAEGPAYGRSSLSAALNAPASQFYTAGFTAAYQLDLFGRLRRAIEAARANAGAAQATADATRVTIAAQTAGAYANICGFGEQLAVARQSLAIVQKTYDLVIVQRDAGALSDFDVARERTILEQTRASIPMLEGQRRANLFVLAALVGHTPGDLPPAVGACAVPPKLTRPLPVGDGVQLLRRRPDLRGAERSLAAATARIGVATADLYPTISIGGGYTAAAGTLGGLGSASNGTYSIGPLLSWSFPNILTARDHIREAGDQARAALADFDGQVLKALSETEQALSSYAAGLEQNRALIAAQSSASRALELSNVQFQAGSYSFLDLLTVQTTLVAANQAAAQSDQALATQQIAVFQALGGGWEEAPRVVVPDLPKKS